MKALVVFESMFGNTAEVARSVAEGLRSGMDVEVIEVGSVPSLIPDGVGLVVVGGPTHALGLSRPQTRASAAEQPGFLPQRTESGLRDWLEALPNGSPQVQVATFDTRVRRPRVPGSAARKALKLLRRKGFGVAGPAVTFWVSGTRGPLVAGELARARLWGDRIAARATPAQPVDGSTETRR